MEAFLKKSGSVECPLAQSQHIWVHISGSQTQFSSRYSTISNAHKYCCLVHTHMLSCDFLHETPSLTAPVSLASQILWTLSSTAPIQIASVQNGLS